MAIYSLAANSAAVTQGAAACEIRSTSAHKPKIFELGFSQSVLPATTSISMGIGRPAAIGQNPGGPVKVIDEQDGNGPTALTTMATAWGTAPTVPANFFRRTTVTNATLGTGAIFSFPRGLALAITSSVVLWVITVSSSVGLDMWAVVDE